MRLKKIEIVGFKSFADREAIQVDDHVTGVIGPNGCGKSNIVDAVRWAMGEQSAKHLRGSGMADVIFAGCATRGAAGMAEVTLIFENEGDVPSPYTAYPEIGVTRRLYADGTSEYLINKVPARLRDITELLLGTGAGTKGYSIIEQGQVGRLVSSKPDDRRHVIDEAAGITRFKGQKAAAERKIVATRQNLLRVSDVIAELESRLSVLKRQAQKAERYRRYKTELRDLDLWTASHEFLELRSMGAVLDERRDDLSRQVFDLRTELTAREGEVSAKRVELSEVEQQLAERQQRVFGIDNRIGLIESETEYRARETQSLTASSASARGEVEVVTRTIDGLETERAEVRGQREILHGATGGAERTAVDQASEAFQALEVREQEAQHDVESLRTRLNALREELATGSVKQAAEEEALAELRTRASALAGVVAGLEEERAADEAAASTCEQTLASARGRVETLRTDRAQLDLRRTGLRDDIAQAEVVLDTARGELSRARSRLTSLEEIQERYRGCASGVQVVMEHQAELSGSVHTDGSVDAPAPRPAVMGILADHIHAPEHLESALSAVLGDHLEGVVVDGPAAGVRGVELLKRVQEGRTAFLPRSVRGGETHDVPRWSADAPVAASSIEVVDLSGTPSDASPSQEAPAQAGVLGRLADLVEVSGEYSPLVSVLVGETVVVDGLPRALELFNGRSVRAPIVTLDGDRIEPSGVVVGGSSQALDSALLQQKREIRELSDVTRELEENLQEAKSRHHALASTLREIETAREANEEALMGAEQGRMSAQKELEAGRARVAELSRRHAETSAQHAEVANRVGERQAAVARLAQAQASRSGELPAVEQGLRDAQSRVVELAAEHTRASEVLTDAKIALARWQQQSDAIDNTLERLGRQLASERERERRLQERIASSERRLAEIAAESEAASTERSDLLVRSKEATAAVHDSRERYDGLRLAIDELDLSLRNLRTQLDEERERLKDVELGLQQNSLQRGHLEADIRERFDTELTDVLVDFHARKMAGKAERDRQKELKRILSRMGEVNLTAIDEYDEVSSRYEYLTGQRDDLESAIGQLQEAIDRINKTTRERFRETFELVNAKFQEVFPRLFAGGRAELRLTDPSDLLSTGVEIHAQPPGKQLRSLDLLSGGEKALTATSLIFAVFLIKPSPFCILDEVDAPLDDANVGRFCNLVRELADKTQFIIITHNKITMETADRLYGVTMQQRGVSKLVSVNMRRAIELAYN